MKLSFNLELAEVYKSKSQIARILTEFWVLDNSYCPCCGREELNSFPNNKPVADFFCINCKSEFELKAHKNPIRRKVVDGAYKTMVDRISSYCNPHFFFLNYTKNFYANNFLVIPGHFFSPEIIEKRNPLKNSAKRAGWIGCNILIGNLPEISKIYLVKQGNVIPKNEVIHQWNKATFLKDENIKKRGWLVEIMGCIDKIHNQNFSIADLYNFETYLKKRYPNNKYIKEKIRQQLQVLRDKEYIEFLGQGKYRKL